MTEGESPSPATAGAADTSLDAADADSKPGADTKKVAAEGKSKPSKTGPKKKRSGVRAVVFAVLLLGVAVAAWSILGKRVQPDLPGSEPSALDRVINRAKDRSSKTPLAASSTAVRPSTGTSSAKPSGPSSSGLAAMENRLRALERARPAASGDNGLTEGALEDLESRVARLEQLVTELPGLPAAGAEGSSDGAAVAQVSGRLDNLEQRLARAERQGAGVQTALAFALGQLRAAVVEGRTFRSDLDRVSALGAKVAGPSLAGSPGARMVQSIDQLRRHSSGGIPTLAALQQSLNNEATDILRAAAQNPDSEWTDSLRARLSSVVRVRRTGEIEGTDPEARLARAEARLNEGDLPAAYAEIDTLGGAAQSAASGWLADARARITSLAGLEALETAVGDALAEASRRAPTDDGSS